MNEIQMTYLKICNEIVMNNPLYFTKLNARLINMISCNPKTRRFTENIKKPKHK